MKFKTKLKQHTIVLWIIFIIALLNLICSFLRYLELGLQWHYGVPFKLWGTELTPLVKEFMELVNNNMRYSIIANGLIVIILIIYWLKKTIK